MADEGFWHKIKKNDRLKLLYAYALYPLLMMYPGEREIIRTLNRYGYRLSGRLPFRTLFALIVMCYFLYIFPPTMIRFVFKRRKLGYGLELYLNMLLSIAIILLLSFLMAGQVDGSLGLLGTLAIYCILSYGSTERNDIPNGLRYTLTGVTLIAPFILIYLESLLKTRQAYFPLWEALFLSAMVNCHRDEAPQPEVTTPESNNDDVTDDSYDDFTQMKADVAQELVDVGLASIGRKTRRANPKLTPDSETARRQAERPFLKVLADRYKDESQRKKLGRHFMLYKEMSLFIIFGALLKQDAELHSMVKIELKSRLSYGLSEQAKTLRDGYWRELTQNFYSGFKRSGNMSEALKSSFVVTAAARYPDWLNEAELSRLCTGEQLMRIFKYSYGAVEVIIRNL